MKKLFAVGVIAVMTSVSASAQVAETKAPAKKKIVRVPAKVQGGSASAESKVALNPQPLPPKQKVGSASAESKVALNPQPLPPKQQVGSTSKASKVSLNPQPLPPKQKVGATSAESKVSSEPAAAASEAAGWKYFEGKQGISEPATVAAEASCRRRGRSGQTAIVAQIAMRRAARAAAHFSGCQFPGVNNSTTNF